MKALILAGGYAKRLWPVTKHIPKQLLPVAGKAIIDYSIEKLELVKVIDEDIISINAFFEFNFKDWFDKYQFRKNTKLVIEETFSDAQKLGLIGALDYLIKKLKINDDLLIIGGDNLFDFSIREFIEFSNEKKTSCIALYDIKDKEKVKGRYGIGEIDSNNKVIGLEEKPEDPKTSLVNTACCIIRKEDIKLIAEYVADENNNRDAFGFLISWLAERKSLHAFVFDTPWFDIGSFEAYDAANEYYLEKRKSQSGTKKIIK